MQFPGLEVPQRKDMKHVNNRTIVLEGPRIYSPSSDLLSSREVQERVWPTERDEESGGGRKLCFV